MSHALCLEQITAWGLAPPDFVHLGAELGCAAVSLWVQSPTPQAIAPPLVDDAALLHATQEALNQSGLGVITVECFVLASETDISDYEAAFAAGAKLRAKAATVIAFDPDPLRQQENFNRLAALAAQYELALNIEFLAFSTVPNLAAAKTLVQNSKAANAGIAVDSLHLTRSGGNPAELSALPFGLLGTVQICDGPPSMAPELQAVHEGFEQRMIPGEGSFALIDFIRALPPAQIIGVEVPLKNLADAGIPVEERARRAIAGTRHVLEQAYARCTL